MSIPAGNVQWTVNPERGGNVVASVTLTGSSQVAVLELFDLPIDCVHIYGNFNSTTVSLLGSNTNDTSASATPQALHTADNSSNTFSAIGSELLAQIVENPRYLFAKSNGAVTSVTISVMMVDRKSK